MRVPHELRPPTKKVCGATLKTKFGFFIDVYSILKSSDECYEMISVNFNTIKSSLDELWGSE